MKVFALGGSSSIGQAAIRVLLDAGHEVCGTFAPASRRGSTARPGCGPTCARPPTSTPSPSLLRARKFCSSCPASHSVERLTTYEDDQISEVVDVNFSGQFRAIQRIAPVLADGSHILILGSQAGQRGSSDPLYGATKGAMHALAKSLAKSLAPRTRVNVVAPGMVTETAIHDGTAQAVLDMHRSTTPTGHFISADELAHVLLDIIQPHWAQLNGACIDLNGGMYVR